MHVNAERMHYSALNMKVTGHFSGNVAECGLYVSLCNGQLARHDAATMHVNAIAMHLYVLECIKY